MAASALAQTMRLPPASPWRFTLTTLAWSVALFGVIRHPWMERVVVQALIDVQRTLAVWYGARPTGAVSINASCSGADVAALCVGAMLAYPVKWRLRLAGTVGGVLLILAINTIRIGTLLTTVPGSAAFDWLHLYLWPTVLIVMVLLYVLAWSRVVERRNSTRRRSRTVIFGITAVALLLVEAAVAPWVMTSAITLGGCAWVASTARLGFELFSVPTTGTGSVLMVGTLGFQVTPECLLTPTLPVYLAAVLSAPMRSWQRVAGAAAAVPLFFALAVARVLVLAVPPALVASPIVAVHGFFQILLGLIVVVGVSIAFVGRDASHAARLETNIDLAKAGRALLAVTGALASAAVVSRPWDTIVEAGARLAQRLAPHSQNVLQPPGDIQGALLLLPGYQLALLTGLWVAAGRGGTWRRFPSALLCLLCSQVLLLVFVGELGAHLGIAVHAIAIRAWAVIVPIGLFALFHSGSGEIADRRQHRRFWTGVGEDFPSLTGASSTDFYFANEVRLLSQQIPNLPGSRVLKSDLWDEAKNTRILQWMAAQGARVSGIDISEPIVHQARDAFDGARLDAALADVRGLPFVDGVFDAIYSMGTIEHFAESEAAVRDMARVLKPGGRLVLGVPNRHDPFLRPLLVAILSRCGLYAYGFEKSYSRRELRAMLERSGLQVVDESGILFIPGWLRMLDLACYTFWPPLGRITAPSVWLFAWLDRRFPGLRRHGYLLASTAVKPADQRLP